MYTCGCVSVVVYVIVYSLFTLCEVFSVHCMCIVIVFVFIVGSFIVCVVTLALKSSFNAHPGDQAHTSTKVHCVWFSGFRCWLLICTPVLVLTI